MHAYPIPPSFLPSLLYFILNLMQYSYNLFFSISGAIFELFGSSLLVEYVREMCIFEAKRLRASEVHHVNVCGSKS